MSDPKILTKQDKDSFLKVLENEKPWHIWVLFLSHFLITRKDEPGVNKVIYEMTNFGQEHNFSDD